MLRNFLWLFSLEVGAYFIGLSGVALSCGLMLTDVSFLQHSGMNQGNLAFSIVYLLTSLLLVNGVYQVAFDTFPSRPEINKNYAILEKRKVVVAMVDHRSHRDN